MRDRTVLQSSAGETLAEGSEPRRYTVFVGGFPCQDLSIAGRQKGLHGERSGLHREYLAVIGSLQPDWVVTENVAHTWRRWVPELRREFHQIGYASLPLRVRASDLGAPHERSRIFLVANTDSELLRELSRWWRGPGWEMAKEFRHSQDWRPGTARTYDGIPAEMDVINGIDDEEKRGKKSESEANELRRKILLTVWRHRETAKASPELYTRIIRDLVPEMPCRGTQERWHLGAWAEKDEGLRNLWNRFYSESHEEQQDLQQRLLERIREKKRDEAMERKSWRARNRAIGNSIVPQIAEIIATGIKEVMK